MELLRHKSFYKLYMTLTQNQKREFKIVLRKTVRKNVMPMQDVFYLAVAHHFLDDNNQYRPEIMQTPLYIWCRDTLFNGYPKEMFYYLVKVKRDNPNFVGPQAPKGKFQPYFKYAKDDTYDRL